MSILAVGTHAPNPTLVAADGSNIATSTLWADRTLVLFFYPKDETAGCTKEACTFRDRYEDFLGAGADVVGVSADNAASHASFASHHRLPFRLYSDPKRLARAAFGVERSLGVLEGRVTYVIDRSGVIRCSFSSLLRFEAHVEEALAVVKGLAVIEGPAG